MDDIDEATAPPKPEEEEEFRPYYPEKAEDEGFLTQQGLKKKLSRLGEGWLVPEPGDEITGISIDYPFLSSILLSGSFQFLSSDMIFLYWLVGVCVFLFVFLYLHAYPTSFKICSFVVHLLVHLLGELIFGSGPIS